MKLKCLNLWKLDKIPVEVCQILWVILKLEIVYYVHIHLHYN